MYHTTRIRMARKPVGQLATSDFKQEEISVAPPAAGEVICQTRFISLDPYLVGLMRRWEGPQKAWSEGIIVGRMAGQIIESNAAELSPGDWVIGDSHWQGLELAKARHLQKISVEEQIPASAYLGLLGSSGLTAWVGTRKIIDIQAGETLTISSAAGTVGAIAGQLAKASGARVVGIAGGAAKCREVVEKLGFDACVDHLKPDFEAQLAAAVPEGIDAHFENVGAKTLDPTLSLMKEQGRIGLCGLIAHYLDEDPITLRNFRTLLTSGLSLRGFRVYDHLQHTAQAQNELKAAIKNGSLLIRETITTGLNNAPQAYIDMLAGKGTGKHILALTE